MIRGLAACALGDPYGAERNQTRLAPDDARDGWVNLAPAIRLSGGRGRDYFERGAQSGEFAAERRNGALWLKRAEVEARAGARRGGGSEGEGVPPPPPRPGRGGLTAMGPSGIE